MGHGEFPIIVLAPTDLKDAFFTGIDAFNFAEMFQTPVIVLLDKNLANSTQVINFDLRDLEDVRIERGKLLSEEVLIMLQNNGKHKRFEFTETGISPRVFLGERYGIFWNTGDEHDGYGHITKNSEIRTKMMEKRMKKLELVNQWIYHDKKFQYFRNSDLSPMISIVTWGPNKGPILDVMEQLKRDGISAELLVLRLLYPLT